MYEVLSSIRSAAVVHQKKFLGSFLLDYVAEGKSRGLYLYLYLTYLTTCLLIMLLTFFFNSQLWDLLHLFSGKD